MNIEDSKKRFEVAEKLLAEDSTTVEKVESGFTLLRGIHPKIEKVLEPASRAFANLKKLQEGKIIEMSAENLPAQTEEQKKRKKALVLFIKTLKDLRSEVERVKSELEKGQTSGSQISSIAKIASFAKGPFGVITLAAVLIAAFLIYSNINKNQIAQNQTVDQLSNSPKSKIQAIEFQGKIIPLIELEERSGPDCDSAHYHAKNHASVKTLDGEIISDPGACAYGKVKEVKIIEIEP